MVIKCNEYCFMRNLASTMWAFAKLTVHRKLCYNTVIQLWPLAEVPPLFQYYSVEL